MDYSDLGSYLAAYRTKAALAVVPIPLVADHLDMSPAGVSAMVRSGKLEGVRIGRQPFVRIESLIAYEQLRAREVSLVEGFLKALARKQTSYVFYEPVMKVIGLDWRIPADRNRIGVVLGTISERSAEEHPRQKLMLSVLVHRKKAGVTRPGQGFFDLAKALGHKWSDDDDFVRRHTRQVLAAYQ